MNIIVSPNLNEKSPETSQDGVPPPHLNSIICKRQGSLRLAKVVDVTDSNPGLPRLSLTIVSRMVCTTL